MGVFPCPVDSHHKPVWHSCKRVPPRSNTGQPVRPQMHMRGKKQPVIAAYVESSTACEVALPKSLLASNLQAEISGPNVLILRQRLAGAMQIDLTMCQHEAIIAHSQRHLDILLDQQHSQPFILQFL
jgi:hypothetical protein